MTPERAFLLRWTAELPEDKHAAFFEELALLITREQERERRRLTTDASYYRRSVEEPKAELRQHAGLPS